MNVVKIKIFHNIKMSIICITFFLVLTNVQTWTSLNVLFNERQIKPHINQDKHLNWSNLNIYENPI